MNITSSECVSVVVSWLSGKKIASFLPSIIISSVAYPLYHIFHITSQMARFKKIQGDSKRWTKFCTSIFPEQYMLCE